MSCQCIHYLHEEHDAFFAVCEKFDAVRALQAKGIQAWPSPDVMEFMGAKDALTKIA